MTQLERSLYAALRDLLAECMSADGVPKTKVEKKADEVLARFRRANP